MHTCFISFFFFFSSRRRHTRFDCDWSSDVCSSDLERYLSQGRLPNLAKLRADGFYAPLRPTNPPQTPVSWASFTTGLNPGRTEIFDFLRRTDGTYLPEFAMIRVGRKPLLFGVNNAPVLGSMAGGGAGLLLLVGTLADRKS